MKCEVKDCEYQTEHTNTYEIDDKIMSRHLTVHLIEGLRDIARYLVPTLIVGSQTGPQDKAGEAVTPKPIPTPANAPALPATPVSARPVETLKGK